MQLNRKSQIFSSFWSSLDTQLIAYMAEAFGWLKVLAKKNSFFQSKRHKSATFYCQIRRGGSQRKVKGDWLSGLVTSHGAPFLEWAVTISHIFIVIFLRSKLSKTLTPFKIKANLMGVSLHIEVHV